MTRRPARRDGPAAPNLVPPGRFVSHPAARSNRTPSLLDWNEGFGGRSAGTGMGIQDRDYYRDGSGGFLGAWGRQGVTVWLIAITCGVVLGQMVTGQPLNNPLAYYGA